MPGANVAEDESMSGPHEAVGMSALRDAKSVFQVPLSELYMRGNGEVPAVLVDIIAKLDKSKVHADRVFRGPINENLVRMFRGLYDGGHRQPLHKCFEVYTVAGLLKSFLLELPKPLFAETLVESLVSKVDEAGPGATAEDSISVLQGLVTQMPTCERRTLKYILFYLNRSCQQKSVCLTNSSRKAVARIFVPILFKRKEDCPEAEILERSLCAMIEFSDRVFSPFSADGKPSEGSNADAKQAEASETSDPQRRMAPEDLDASVEAKIADTVDSLFSGPPSDSTAPASQQLAPKSKVKKVLKEHSLNLVQQKEIPGLEEMQKVVKPTVKPDDMSARAAPLDFDDMGYEDLLREKKRIKKCIKAADGDLAKKLGRKPTQADKEPLRPMYSHYWKVKRLLERSKARKTPRSGDSRISDLLKY